VIIGVARDIKTDERRVALLPEHVKRLIEEGHSVWVEAGAGKGAGFNDEEYAREGARITSKEKLYEESGMIVKVKCPFISECRFLRDGQIVFAYLHFDGQTPVETIKEITSTGVTSIAYEWVEEGKDLPLLRPMSELSGTLFALRSMELLMKNKRILPGGFFNSVEPPKIMIIGIGRIGANALKVALMNNMNIVIVDKHPETLEKRALKYIDEESWRQRKGKIKIIKFNNENPPKTLAQIAALMDKLDILINCAVRRADLPKSRMEYLITKEMVSKMQKGSVVCDATASDEDFLETAVSSERLLETYEVNGVIHYNCDHIPSLVPQAASILLANAVLPYVQLLANEGFEGAIGQSQALVKAVMCHQGFITHEYTSKKKNLAYKDIKTLCRI
jgi:alanine dehydrogenase